MFERIRVKVNHKVKDTYGFYPNLKYSARHNACLILRHSPTFLLRSRPTNLAYHDLCLSTKMPRSLRSLLGLGLNFCPQPTQSSSHTDLSLNRFRLDYNRRIFFSGNLDDNYKKSRIWVPSPSLQTRNIDL